MGSYAQNLRRLRDSQKPGNGVPAYTRWVNRPVARYAAAAAATVGMTANGVTLLSAATSLGGLAVLLVAPVSWTTGLAAAVLLAIGYVLDSADGQVARLTGTGGPAGEWFDHVVDAIRTPAVHLTVALCVWRNEQLPVWLGYIAVAYALVSTGQFMSQILAEQLRHKAKVVTSPDGREIGKSIIILPNDMGTLCWIFSLWGATALFATAYTALFAVNAIHSAVSMRRKYVGLKAAGAAALPS